jgi:hypothetical protein
MSDSHLIYDGCADCDAAIIELVEWQIREAIKSLKNGEAA